MYSLFATAFDKFSNGPNALLNAGCPGGRATDRTVNFAEVVIREIQRNRSFKVYMFLAERIG